MDLHALQKTIARGIYEIGCEDEFALTVARFKEWKGSTLNHRRRVWQALSDRAQRGFDASWVLLAQRLFAYHGRADLCSELVGSMMQAQWEGEREREESPERAMRKVVPRAVSREVAS